MAKSLPVQLAEMEIEIENMRRRIRAIVDGEKVVMHRVDIADSWGKFGLRVLAYVWVVDEPTPRVYFCTGGGDWQEMKAAK